MKSPFLRVASGIYLTFIVFYLALAVLYFIQGCIEMFGSTAFSFFNALIYFVSAIFMVAIAAGVWKLKNTNTAAPLTVVLIVFVISLSIFFGQGTYQILSESQNGLGPVLRSWNFPI